MKYIIIPICRSVIVVFMYCIQYPVELCRCLWEWDLKYIKGNLWFKWNSTNEYPDQYGTAINYIKDKKIKK